MTHMSQITQPDLGNTIPNPKTSNRRIRSRKWCLTINNYNEKLYSEIVTITQGFQHWIIGKEIGEEKKTPHLQIYIENKNAVDFTKIKKMYPTAHIEKAKGNRKQNYIYCSKEGNFTTNMDFTTPREKAKMLCLEEYKGVIWKDWQAKILELIKGKPLNRKIHWYWEKKGNIGKSFLVKWIVLNRKCIICSGKKDDIFNQVNTMLETDIPEIVILDIPRSAYQYVNYGAIEALVGGLLYSGKYEGGLAVFPQPHVICFANKEPEMYEMSEDRWIIEEL